MFLFESRYLWILEGTLFKLCSADLYFHTAHLLEWGSHGQRRTEQKCKALYQLIILKLFYTPGKKSRA